MAGKLIKRSKKWSFKYYDNGKELRYTCNATTFEDAKDEQSIFLANLKNSNSYKPERCLLAPFVKKYLEVSKTDKAKRTYISARTLLNHFLKNIPETIKYLDEITFDILQEYKTKEKERGQSINSLNTKIMKIKALFNYAIEDKKLKDNPAKRLKYIKQGRKIPHFLSIDEINKYKNADTIRNIYYLANLVALYTGFRPEEVYYLTKKDIDMNNRRISVNPKKNWQPKTYEARTNPMSNNLMIIIKEIYALIGNSEWLITDYTRNRPSYQNYTTSTAKVFKRKEINIKNATMYIMRHTFASHLAMRGESLKAIQELLGHADIKTTMIYANVSPAYLNNAVAKLPY